MFGSKANSHIAQDLAGRHPGQDSGHRPNFEGPPRSGHSINRDKEVDASAVLCRLLSLLSDRTRLRILWLLADGEKSVGAMTAELGLPQPTVSHHLAWLRTMHLVSPRRAGKNVFYALGRAARSERDGSLSLLTADHVVSIQWREPD